MLTVVLQVAAVKGDEKMVLMCIPNTDRFYDIELNGAIEHWAEVSLGSEG